MFGESRTGIFFAAAATRAFASGVKPVEPMTSGTPRSAQTSAWRADASWLVKSITAPAPESAFESSSTTRTPIGPSPASVPTSWPTAAPARSTAPETASPSVARTSRRICVPIRPAAPVTTTFTMGVSLLLGELQAELDHGLPHLREARLGHRREREPQLAGSLAHQRDGRLHRARVRLDEHHPVELGHRDLEVERPREVGLPRGDHELLHRARRDVAHDGDDAVAAAGDVRQDREVVAGQERDLALPDQLH